MYLETFGLSEKPFDLLPNPKFLYPSRTHRRVQTFLHHGIREKAGFILLTGEVGSGKTTIIRQIIKKELSEVTLAKVFNTRVDSLQLLAMINDDFGLETAGRDKAGLLRDLNDFLIAEFSRGREVVLIIDEAQNLSADLLEEVRMLSNLETDSGKLLQIILVGQPELRETLSAASLRQLRQRIQVNCHIDPLTQEEVEQYVLHRLERAGNREALVFGKGAMDAIYELSRGIPRLINILCDYILLDAYATETPTVNWESVQELAAELSFESQYWQGGNGDGPDHEVDGHSREPKEDRQKPEADAAAAGDGRGRLKTHLLALNRRIARLENENSDDVKHACQDLYRRLDEMEKSVRCWHDQVRQELESLQELWARNGAGEELVDPSRLGVGTAGDDPGTMRQLWRFLRGE